MTTASTSAVPYPLHRPGPWWSVFKVSRTKPGVCYSIDHIPFYDNAEAARAALDEEAARCPEALLELGKVDEAWNARCVQCGETVEDEDYFYTSWNEVVSLVAGKKNWNLDEERRLLWCRWCAPGEA